MYYFAYVPIQLFCSIWPPWWWHLVLSFFWYFFFCSKLPEVHLGVHNPPGSLWDPLVPYEILLFIFFMFIFFLIQAFISKFQSETPSITLFITLQALIMMMSCSLFFCIHFFSNIFFANIISIYFFVSDPWYTLWRS